MKAKFKTVRGTLGWSSPEAYMCF